MSGSSSFRLRTDFGTGTNAVPKPCSQPEMQAANKSWYRYQNRVRSNLILITDADRENWIAEASASADLFAKLALTGAAPALGVRRAAQGRATHSPNQSPPEAVRPIGPCTSTER